MLKVRCLAIDLWEIQMSRHIWRNHRALQTQILLCRYTIYTRGPVKPLENCQRVEDQAPDDEALPQCP